MGLRTGQKEVRTGQELGRPLRGLPKDPGRRQSTGTDWGGSRGKSSQC